MTDPVHSPDHYLAGGIETIDILKAKLTPEEFRGFLLGNVIKYVTRARHKNGKQDLEKARWYLDRLIGEQVPEGGYIIPPNCLDEVQRKIAEELVSTTGADGVAKRSRSAKGRAHLRRRQGSRKSNPRI